MELTSRIPAPLAIHVDLDPSTRFRAHWGGEVADLTEHLADLAVLGLLLGPAQGDAAVGAAIEVGTPDPGCGTVGTWELTGPARATMLSEEGTSALSDDELGTLAAAGLLRTLADAETGAQADAPAA
jgi:hypothetical protein